MTVFPFVRRQHAQFSWKRVFASSCLHLEHIHTCVVMLVSLVIFFCCFDFASTYNHSATSGTPIMKKTMIVRIGILSMNNEIPKHSVPIPSIESQRVVVSILSPALVCVTLFLFSNFCTWLFFLLLFTTDQNYKQNIHHLIMLSFLSLFLPCDS